MAEDRDRQNPEDVTSTSDEAMIGSADDDFEDVDELDDDEEDDDGDVDDE